MGQTTKIICLWLTIITATSTSCFAAATSMAVSATILSNNQCKFKNPSSRDLPFGNLDPLNATDVILQSTLQFTCNGKDASVTYFIGDDATTPGVYQMQRLTPSVAYLPYTLAISPLTGTELKGTDIILTITATVLGNDYRLAPAGYYSDQVIVTVQP